MRNKGAIVVLTLIITALCLYYLSFTFVSRNIQKEAVVAATNEAGVVDLTKKQVYLDSIWNEPVYSLFGMDYTFKEIKDTELNLGLDLQGGMHVVLEVSPVEILKGLSGNNEDPDFIAAINMAIEKQKTSQETYSSLFYESFKEIKPDGKLSTIFANAANRGKISFETTDQEIMKIINAEIEDAMDRSFNILRTRIDRFGTSQPNIQRLQGTGRIQVEIPGADNPARVRKLLQGAAKLEFFEVATPQESGNFLQAINAYLVAEQKANTQSVDLEQADAPAEEEKSLQGLLGDGADSSSVANADSANADAKLDSLYNSQVSPIFSLITSQEGLVYNVKDTFKINRIFKRADVKALVPRGFKFAWDVKAHDHDDLTAEPHIELHILKVGRGGKAPLEGDVITDARQSLDQATRPSVSMQMNASGAKKWRKLTAANIGERIAIVLDGYVYSAPNVNGEIPNGNSEISGNFSIEEAKDLANVLKAGTLPAPTRIVQEAIIGPTLGAEAQVQGAISILAGLGLVVLFMVFYYARGGFVANFALLFNIFFIMGILAQLSAALTLPGIAGIVLTIGMSIDANVLIFERIREELRNGVALREAVSSGYKKAFSSIIDSNVTTFLTAAILYSLGQGPVKGFAITLMIGIGSSFFSAVFITRVVIEQWLRKKGDASNLNFKTKFSAGLLSNMNVDFMSKRVRAYIASGILISVGMVLLFVNGLNLGVDFQGGRSYVVSFNQPVVASDIKASLTATFDGAGTEVKTFGANNVIKVTTSYQVSDESSEMDEKVQSLLVAGLAEKTGQIYIKDGSKVDDTHFAILSSEKVGATIADDIKKDSMKAMLLSLVVIFLYIVVRFRKWQFGLGAIVALFHDTLLVLSAFAIAGLFGFSFEIDQVFIAAILTIIGYSINDTVIVFDRIRENISLHTSSDREDIFNAAINSTMNRTVITSLTTLVVVLVLLIFGGAVLRGFSFALVIGVLVGTYSSIFIASPIVLDLDKKK
ncbi:Protein translocase subunit SecD / Protein translocase subunit SecF [hydrothermal vent metagenome]|uniref:Protein translocase subunit SecD / Protein translocase subunit SecF n=1 Tax=hydrothermal vent metagenome TaxID=652676 RepID=A0A3B0U8Z5_9ZZZZ